MTQEHSIPYQGPAAPWQQTVGPAWRAPAPLIDSIPDTTATRAVLAALAAGFLGQLLFVDQRAGINVLVWVAVVIAASWALRRPGARIDRLDLWLPPGALAAAAFIVLRDDLGLLLFDFLAAGAMTLASAVAIGGHPVTRRTLAGITRLGAAAVAVAWGGGGSIARRFRPLARMLPSGRHTTATRIALGLVIALPLLLAFTALFAAADAVFQSYLANALTVDIDTGELIGRTVAALLIGWVFAGTMAAVWLSRERFAPQIAAAHDAEPTAAAGPRLGTIEALTVLLLLDALFAAFVVIQAAYLFPGTDPLAATGLTYSAYARRGFFELLAVAILAGAVVVLLDRFVERRTNAFRVAAVALAVLTGAVLVSAIWRLSLYQQAYGWTELRFYALAAIVWVALGLVAVLAAIVVDRVGVLPKFMVGPALLIALVCNVIGPQSFVTDQNLQRALNPSLVPADGYAGLDTLYFGSLGADSIPVIVAALDRLEPSSRAQLSIMLQTRARRLRVDAAELGWPSWNYSRQRALEALTAAGF